MSFSGADGTISLAGLTGIEILDLTADGLNATLTIGADEIAALADAGGSRLTVVKSDDGDAAQADSLTIGDVGDHVGSGVVNGDGNTVYTFYDSAEMTNAIAELEVAVG